jgi:general secretion pathway protein C
MLARLSAFFIWALVAGAAVFWGMRLVIRPSPPPANAVALSDAPVATGSLSGLLGAEEVAAVAVIAPESTRFKLLGVMAGKPDMPSAGVALISIDGKPPRTYSPGKRVEEQLVLLSVGLRTASFGPEKGPVSFTLEIPPMPPPATGTLDQVPGASDLQPAPAVAPAANMAPAIAPPPPQAIGQPAMPPQGVPQPGNEPPPGSVVPPQPIEPSGLVTPPRLRNNGSGR